MKLKEAFLIVLFLLSGFPVAAATHKNAGTSGAAILGRSFNARLSGLGGAGAAVADDITTNSLNPAGLGELIYPEIYLNHQSLHEDIDHEHVAAVVPLTGATSATWDDMGALSFSAEILDYGTFSGRDASGSRASDFSFEDKLYSIGYGKRVWPGLSLGSRVKYFKVSSINQNEDGVAVDAGLRYQAYQSPWAMGAAIQNLGSEVQLETQSDRLPESFVAGVALFPLKDRLILAADFIDPKFDKPGARGGVECWLNSTIGLRGGYNSLADAGSGFTVGLSIQVMQFEAYFFPIRRLRLDYALSLANEESDGLDNTHQISLAFQFGEDGGVSR